MASNYEYIMVEGEEIVTVTLNRPDIHNPFDEKMIAELTDAFSRVNKMASARVLIITGAGKSFCAGADLNWMKRMGQYSRDENIADAEGLSDMFRALRDIEVPTIAKVNGAAFGGGAGLVCACDIAIASSEAKLGFSEVRLGLLPGVISSYVVERIGPKVAVRLFTTGDRLNSDEALRLGVLDAVAPPDGLDKAVADAVDMILAGGPGAVKACKRLARACGRLSGEELRRYCIEAIADARSSPEGKGGVNAFLEKRAPSWRSK